jgi:hypothetical protein
VLGHRGNKSIKGKGDFSRNRQREKKKTKGLNRVEKNRKGMTKGKEQKGEDERVKRV